MDNSCIEYSIVVPVYNSAQTLRQLVDRIAHAMVQRRGDSEVILVDDGSIDDSGRIASEIANEKEFVHAIHLSRNVGQHQATLQGFALSRGKCVITIDDDLQHPPEEIGKLIEAIEGGWVVAIGRFQRSRHPLHKRLMSVVKRFIERRVYRMPRHMFISGFRALQGDVARQLADTATADPYLPAEIYKSVAFDRIRNVDVRHDPTMIGRSRYGAWKSIRFVYRLLRESFKTARGSDRATAAAARQDEVHRSPPDRMT